MLLKKSALIGIGILVILGAIIYLYVFVAGAPQFDPPQLQVTNLTFQLESFNSQAMGITRQYGVILPPRYTQNPQRRYPVIFLLHGGHDDARAFYDKYAVTLVLHQLYQARKLPESIIITPDGNDQRGPSPLWDPQYYDGANGKLGTLIGSELPQIIKSRYRTLNEPKFWAIGGVSSGGWGTVNIGLHHLDQFNILFSHSGYFTDSSGVANSPNEFITQLSANQLKALRIYLDAGESDTDLLTSTQQFHQTLSHLSVANVFYAFPGGHGLSGADFGWNYFHKHLTDSLGYVGSQFKTGGL